MNVRRAVAACVVALSLTACATQEEAGDSDGTWVGTITTEGNVTTVVNESGSVWGGMARLEEELAIGDEGRLEAAYLFGAITAAWATDSRIYVVDSQVPAVRAFDHRGEYLTDIGRAGQGPGEYSRPVAMAVDGDGRVVVADFVGARLNVYDADGATLESWALDSPMAAMGLMLSYDGRIYSEIMVRTESPESRDRVETRWAMQAVGPDGLTGEPSFPPPTDYERPTATVRGGSRQREMAIVPFTPSYQWAFTPGAVFVAGVGDEYRFEIRRSDGSVMVVQKTWEPVPVQRGEAAFHGQLAAQQVRQIDPRFRVDIDPDGIPNQKPAFIRFRPDRSGRIWVEYEGTGSRDPDCTAVGTGTQMIMTLSSTGEADMISGGSGEQVSEFSEGECWASHLFWDVFDVATGEFLGTVPAPERGFRAPLYVEGTVVLASVIDEMGTVHLKKYRLVLPGEE